MCLYTLSYSKYGASFFEWSLMFNKWSAEIVVANVSRLISTSIYLFNYAFSFDINQDWCDFICYVKTHHICDCSQNRKRK